MPVRTTGLPGLERGAAWAYGEEDPRAWQRVRRPARVKVVADMRKKREAEVFLITGARQGLADDVRGRQRRYVISMLIRTASVLLTVLLWNVERPLAVVTLVVGALLPYVAVVVANAGREQPPSLPSTVTLTSTRPQLNSSESVAKTPHSPPDGSMADRS